MSVCVHETSSSARVKWRVMNAWAVCTCTKMQCMNEQRVQVQSVSDMKISVAINETARKKWKPEFAGLPTFLQFHRHTWFIAAFLLQPHLQRLFFKQMEAAVVNLTVVSGLGVFSTRTKQGQVYKWVDWSLTFLRVEFEQDACTTQAVFSSSESPNECVKGQTGRGCLISALKLQKTQIKTFNGVWERQGFS